MRVEVNTVKDFLGEVREEENRIWEKIIRTRIDRVPEQDDQISFQVEIHLTTFIVSSEGKYLLEATILTGCDDPDNDELREGTIKAVEIRDQVEATCLDLGLSLREGKYELF